jgi:SAM-dependent methyltransferase
MKRVPLTPPFAQDGCAYSVVVGTSEMPAGDSCDQPKASPLVLLEDGVPLGPAHAHHYAIREQGVGRFSHWVDTMIFSTSDNTNPNENGRSYAIGVPSAEDLAFYRRSILDGVGADFALTFGVLRASMNTNGSPLALYLNGFSHYRRALQQIGATLEDKVVLEIGAGPNLGTALAFLLHGAGQVIGNDIGRVTEVMTPEYADIIRFLAKLSSPQHSSPLTSIVEGTGQAQASDAPLRLVPQRYTALPYTPAESIALPDGSVDLVVSTSVLEHVMKPREVLENTFRLLRPGGVCIHSIDLRDHANPGLPLGFLEQSRDQYEPTGTENRVRAVDYLRLFESAGYELLHVGYATNRNAADELGNIDGMAAFLDDTAESSSRYYTTLESVEPWVTEAQRETLDPEFRGKSLQDLSVLGLSVIARKP